MLQWRHERLKCFLLKYDPHPHPCKLCALLFYWSSASCDLMVFSASVYFTVWLSVLQKINLILFLSYIAFTYLGTIGKKFLVAQNKQMKKQEKRKKKEKCKHKHTCYQIILQTSPNSKYSIFLYFFYIAIVSCFSKMFFSRTIKIK